MYQSDGLSFMLSAWNMLKEPQSSVLYRRTGFREDNLYIQYIYCNQNIGGNKNGTYDETEDY